MPNWCNNDITIYSSNEEKLKKLSELIDDWTSKDFATNGFGHNWLGNIVGFSEIGKYENDFKTLDDKELRCRGQLIYSELSGGQLNLITETAWAPMLKMWKLICDKYLPDANIIYTSEEPGCGIYYTNDPNIEGSYYVDIWEPPEEFEDEESLYEASKTDVINFLQRVLKTTESDFDKLMSMYENSDNTDWLAINEWKHADIEEFD